MNGFRITILTLLCASLGLMFYAVFFVVPDWQGEYNAYQASQRLKQFDHKSDLHRRQMTSYAPDYETPEVVKAREAAEEAAKKNEIAVLEAQEKEVIESALRQEEMRRVREEQQNAAARENAAKHPPLGVVSSYDKTWNCVMVSPQAQAGSYYEPKSTLAIFRDGRFLCEIIVDSLDVQSGQVSATVRVPQGTIGVNADGSLSAELEPRSGDIVSHSPFPSADDLRKASAREAERYATERADASGVPILQTELPANLLGEEEPTDADAPKPDALPALPEPPAAQQPAAEPRREPDPLPDLPFAAPRKETPLPSMDTMLQPSLF